MGQHELSYDKFFNNAENIYRINKEYNMGDGASYNPSTPYPLADYVRENYPEITDATKFVGTRAVLKYGKKVFNEKGICYADSTYFRVFSFQFVKGNPETALSGINKIVLTEQIAEKYFGNDDPMGKTINVNDRHEVIVSGVIKDLPSNSIFEYNIFLPIKLIAYPDDPQNWGSHWLYTFITLDKNSDVKETEKKLSGLIKERLPAERLYLNIQALEDIHLFSIDGKPVGMKYVYFFSIIAIFILVIACINFINLTTAKSEKRAKEVGLRKVIGARRIQIFRQFFGESLVFTILAMFVALILVELSRPVFNNLVGKQLTIPYSDHRFILSLIIIVLFTGILAGSYPAFFLSWFKPARVLRGGLTNKGKGSLFRKILVIIQFFISSILIFGTIVIYTQLKYIQNKDLGFNKENVLCLPYSRGIRPNYLSFRNELLKNPDIINMGRTSETPIEIESIMRGIVWEGKETEEGAAFAFASIDYDYIETMKMDVVQGRAFSEDFPSDTINYIFNEKAIKIMGMEDPVGKRFLLDEESEEGIIVGVVKDFNSLALNYEIEPLVFLIWDDSYRQLLIRISENNIINTIDYIEEVWEKFAPDNPFEYSFLDQNYYDLYKAERQAGEIFKYFVILAIFISGLGLFGLASFMTEQRTKEVGIRKVNGASVSSIFIVFSRDFIKWIIIAFVFSCPVAWFIMNKWLQNFVYKTNISMWIFIFTGFLISAVALLTVSYQAFTAARKNPAESLRYE